VKARAAVPMSVHVDFAVRELLVVRGVQVKTDRKRASTRKPPYPEAAPTCGRTCHDPIGADPPASFQEARISGHDGRAQSLEVEPVTRPTFLLTPVCA
jgi:hypothetical protein